MRFNNILYQKIRLVGLFALCMLLSFQVNAQVQKTKKVRQLIDVTLKVSDETGTPISQASVVIGEGITHTATDQNGTVVFKGYPTDVVTVTAPGFEKNVSLVSDLLTNNAVKLLKAKIHMTSDDVMPMPFTSLKKRYLTGPEVLVKGSYFERYPSTDIRNSLVGLTSGWDIREQDGSPGLNSQEGLQNLNGLGNSFGATDKFTNVPFVLVDGMPTELTEAPIDPSEIESATLIKGILGTAMYGPMANGGILSITTKKGVKNERMLDVDIESGVSTIDRMPGWANGNDYVRLNNIARVNSGLPEQYSAADINGYAQNDPNSLRYPNVNFRDMMLKNTMSFNRVNVSSSGGNDVIQYYSSIGYAGEGDIYKLGSKSDYNRINTRQNVTVKINDQIGVQFTFYGNLSFRRSPNYGYDAQFTSEDAGSNPVLGLIEMPDVLSDIRSIPPVSFPVYAFIDTATKIPWYGVSSNYTDNPIGNLESQGYYTDRGRTGASNLSLNWNMGNLVEGLKSTTFFGFNIHNMVRLGKANDYTAYIASVTSSGSDTLIKSNDHSYVKQSDMAKLMDYYFQRFNFSQNFTYDKTFGDNTVQAVLTYNQIKAFINGIEEPQRNNNYSLSAMYSFKDKYIIQGLLNYAGTASFSKSRRYGVFPSIGAGWVVSEEGALSSLKFLSYLKLRAQYGIIGNETYLSPFYYIDRMSQNTSGSAFGSTSTYTQWFGTTTDGSVPRVNPQRIGNPDIGWEKRREFNAGFDALFFKQKLSLEMTYWNYLVDGSIVQVNNTLPFTAGLQGARPWYNYNKTRYNMLTADFHYTDKIGELEFTIGGNATTAKGTREKYDEPNYRNDYQKRTGKASDAIFGYVYEGKFATDAETTVVPQKFDAALKAGDLKYADLNLDGYVDDLDQKVIGNSSPRLYYGVNIDLKYKNFELFVLGNGRAFYDIAITNAYFQNGWGDNNYSNFVRDNVDGAYPRLTYYKVNNNFLTSSFWLRNGGYFKIQNVELAYTIPSKNLQFMGGRAVRLYVRGANLLTLSKIKDVDPESINSGVTVYPLFRTFSGGIKLNF